MPCQLLLLPFCFLLLYVNPDFGVSKTQSFVDSCASLVWQTQQKLAFFLITLKQSTETARLGQSCSPI